MLNLIFLKKGMSPSIYSTQTYSFNTKKKKCVMAKMKDYFMRSLNEMTVIKYKERRCLIISRNSTH